MTKSEGIPKPEGPTRYGTPERPSAFMLRITFDICHASFVIRQPVHVPNARANANGALHEPTLVWSPAFRRPRVARPAEAGTPCGRGFMAPMLAQKTRGLLRRAWIGF